MNGRSAVLHVTVVTHKRSCAVFRCYFANAFLRLQYFSRHFKFATSKCSWQKFRRPQLHFTCHTQCSHICSARACVCVLAERPARVVAYTPCTTVRRRTALAGQFYSLTISWAARNVLLTPTAQSLSARQQTESNINGLMRSCFASWIRSATLLVASLLQVVVTAAMTLTITIAILR